MLHFMCVILILQNEVYTHPQPVFKFISSKSSSRCTTLKMASPLLLLFERVSGTADSAIGILNVLLLGGTRGRVVSA